MGTDGVVLDPIVLGEDLGLDERLERLDVQELVAELAVQGLDVGVLSGAAGLDTARAGPGEQAPVAQPVGGDDLTPTTDWRLCAFRRSGRARIAHQTDRTASPAGVGSAQHTP